MIKCEQTYDLDSLNYILILIFAGELFENIIFYDLYCGYFGFIHLSRC